MQYTIKLLIAFAFMIGCGSPSSTEGTTPPPAPPPPPSANGVGEITNVSLNDPLDEEMIKRGKAIYEMKCAACHKLTDQRVVGPGWKGVTTKREPAWIMNMITNVDAMLEKDPEARKLLAECLVRMPNQNISIGDSRDILEFMFELDKAD